MKILVVTHRKHNKFRPKRLPRLGRLHAALSTIQANIKECSVYDLATDDPRSYDLIFIMGAQQSLSTCYSEEWMYIEAKLIEKIIPSLWLRSPFDRGLGLIGSIGPGRRSCSCTSWSSLCIIHHQLSSLPATSSLSSFRIPASQLCFSFLWKELSPNSFCLLL